MKEQELSWLGTPPQISEKQITSEEESDVIVVGAGVAGVAAVRAAVEAKASVLLFEKCAGVQGRFGDFAPLNCKTADLWSRSNINSDTMVADLMRDSCFRADQRIIKTWADHASEDFDWMLEVCPDFQILKTHSMALVYGRIAGRNAALGK